MPEARLPSTLKGWLVVLAASVAGFIAGFLTIALINQLTP